MLVKPEHRITTYCMASCVLLLMGYTAGRHSCGLYGDGTGMYIDVYSVGSVLEVNKSKNVEPEIISMQIIKNMRFLLVLSA